MLCDGKDFKGLKCCGLEALGLYQAKTRYQNAMVHMRSNFHVELTAFELCKEILCICVLLNVTQW